MKSSSYSAITLFREKQILKSYHQLRATGCYGSVKEISRVIASAPTTIHFLSYRSAYLAYHRFIELQDSPYPCDGHPQRKKLYDSFLDACRRIRSEQPHLHRHEIIRLALLSPAPCIGIGAHSISNILFKNGAH